MDALGEAPDFHPVGICRRAEAAAHLRGRGREAHALELTDPELLSVLTNCQILINCILARGSIPEVRRADSLAIELLLGAPPDAFLVHFSSVSVYSHYYTDAGREWRHPNPAGPLGRKKLWAEERFRRGARRAGRPCLIVRPGHVYGAEQHWSREIALIHRNAGLRLPLNGEAASNGIHIRSLVASLLEAIRSRKAGIYDAVHVPQRTWRQVFDWHAEALGCPAVAAADYEQSRRQDQRQRERFTRPLAGRMAREVAGWASSPRRSFLGACPSMKEAFRRGVRLVGGEALEEAIIKRLAAAKSASVAAPGVEGEACEEWLFGDPAPGPALECPYFPGPEEQIKLRRWLEAAGVLSKVGLR
jgi:nucleoside-diphosphate-sugar epimerase